MLPPAFVGGLPGGMELAVIFLMVVSLALPLLLLVAVVRYLDRGSSNDLEERVANLEGQVDALREELRRRDE
ncbi:hypothetical protein [Halobacterium litoreum]|uniref:Sec-independent protein translocase protein TatA n=1 Tax=Halobacterium litoreum TaxID=2039234 RepID=A0ABD5NGU6_9EURY|nr:hypothetical protein [Halobacterium litoreum]UHH12691.1 hypothetical protein LT972_11040 [Halobacterium litoreum]